MNNLVIYDSVFGNTEKVAQAIGAALGAPEQALVLRVTEVNLAQLTDIEILIVGSPTRAFQPTPNIKKFLKSLPDGILTGVKVAAFDTRFAVENTHSKILTGMVKVFGYAAEPIAKLLLKKGGNQASAPEWFIVLESEGPLKDGELERAAVWAAGIKNG